MKPAILYSFRRCPYAIRARMALNYSETVVELREVVLKDKPKALIELSPKATVPVLELVNGEIIDESLDIMYWAFNNKNPKKIKLAENKDNYQHELILENDCEFKLYLDKYKYDDRFPEFPERIYREQGELFLKKLENLLSNHKYLLGKELSIIDLAIFPFIRQFAFVNPQWFEESSYLNVRKWLNEFLASDYFLTVMHKYSKWQLGNEVTYFPNTLSQEKDSL